MTLVRIALGLVWKGPLLLIAKRRKEAHLGGFWEFPGGRLEEGESAEQAAVREVREETGIMCAAAGVRERFEFEYPDRKLEFHAVDCTWVSGQPQALGCIEPTWVSETEIAKHEFPSANAVLLRKLGGSWPSK
jgi:8-oxo-dGTP diphosphatase